MENNTSSQFLIGQRVIVSNEIGTVHAGKTLRNKQGHDVQAGENPQTPGYVWVYLPSRGYACHYSVDNVKPLPNNQL